MKEEQTKEVQKRTGVDVVLNGGKREMNSATIPIEWYLSKEVIEENPKYVLFFEQNEKEAKEIFGGSRYGRRYACKISDAFKYIQLFSSGYHRLMVIILSDAGNWSAEKRAEYYLRKSGSKYENSLSWAAAEEGTLHEEQNKEQILAAIVKEFEVPEQLFAKKPRSNFGEMIWKWTNMPYKDNPKDQCDYRKRKIFAFTLQPPLYLIYAFCKYLIGGVLHALYVLLASISFLFVGLRPKPIFKEMWRAFTYKRYGWSVQRFTRYDVGYKKDRIWGLWSINQDKEGDERYNTFIPPIIVFFLLGCGFGIYKLITLLSLNSWIVVGSVIGGVLVIALMVWGIIKYLDKTSAQRAEKKRLKKVTIQKMMKQQHIAEMNRKKEWMMRNFELSNKKDQVDLKRIPMPDNFTGKVVQKFRVSFWSIKTNVCKPFSE